MQIKKTRRDDLVSMKNESGKFRISSVYGYRVISFRIFRFWNKTDHKKWLCFDSVPIPEC